MARTTAQIVCGRCGNPCKGNAFIDGIPYCHGDHDRQRGYRPADRPLPDSCYELAQRDHHDIRVQRAGEHGWLGFWMPNREKG